MKNKIETKIQTHRTKSIWMLKFCIHKLATIIITNLTNWGVLWAYFDLFRNRHNYKNYVFYYAFIIYIIRWKKLGTSKWALKIVNIFIICQFPGQIPHIVTPNMYIYLHLWRYFPTSRNYLQYELFVYNENK